MRLELLAHEPRGPAMTLADALADALAAALALTHIGSVIMQLHRLLVENKNTVAVTLQGRTVTFSSGE